MSSFLVSLVPVWRLAAVLGTPGWSITWPVESFPEHNVEKWRCSEADLCVWAVWELRSSGPQPCRTTSYQQAARAQAQANCKPIHRRRPTRGQTFLHKHITKAFNTQTPSNEVLVVYFPKISHHFGIPFSLKNQPSTFAQFAWVWYIRLDKGLLAPCVKAVGDRLVTHSSGSDVNVNKCAVLGFKGEQVLFPNVKCVCCWSA